MSEEQRFDYGDATLPTTAGDTRLCPMCGATIKAVAKKCRFCGENLDGRNSSDGVWRLGRQLVMRKGAKLPDRCVKTNKPAERWLKRTLYWHHPLLYLLIPAGVLFYAIAAIIVREKAVIQIGLTQARFNRRRWTIFGAWLVALSGPGLWYTGYKFNLGDRGAMLIFGGALVGFIAVIAGCVGAYLSAIVQPTKITADYVWLKGVHPDYLRALPEFPGE